VAGGAVMTPCVLLAQQKAMPVIGFLSSASPNAYAERVAAFREGLNESGYIDGKDVAIEFRWAKGQYDQLPVFAADLVRQKVAVILSSGGDVAALSAKAATSSIPIVSAGSESDLETAFATLIKQRVGALLVSTDSFFTSQRDRLVALAVRHALPTIYSWREFVEAGGLVSYGPIINEVYREAGIYTARILKGETPADLPFLRPTKFELVVNLKTADALGLTVPQSILARADDVIE
jgi:ABC-type uncharacterized transport system substrate-binding protein